MFRKPNPETPQVNFDLATTTKPWGMYFNYLGKTFKTVGRVETAEKHSGLVEPDFSKALLAMAVQGVVTLPIAAVGSALGLCADSALYVKRRFLDSNHASSHALFKPALKRNESLVDFEIPKTTPCPRHMSK